MTRAAQLDAGAFPRSDSYEALDGDLEGGLVILIDHASNRIPPEYADLGLPPASWSGTSPTTSAPARSVACWPSASARRRC